MQHLEDFQNPGYQEMDESGGMGKGKGSASFCEQKEAKKLFYLGPVQLQLPHVPRSKIFAPLFFKKRLLPSALTHRQHMHSTVRDHVSHLSSIRLPYAEARAWALSASALSISLRHKSTTGDHADALRHGPPGLYSMQPASAQHVAHLPAGTPPPSARFQASVMRDARRKRIVMNLLVVDLNCMATQVMKKKRQPRLR